MNEEFAVHRFCVTSPITYLPPHMQRTHRLHIPGLVEGQREVRVMAEQVCTADFPAFFSNRHGQRLRGALAEGRPHLV